MPVNMNPNKRRGKPSTPGENSDNQSQGQDSRQVQRKAFGEETEQDREKRAFLLWMTDYFRGQLERVLSVLGIEIPEYM